MKVYERILKACLGKVVTVSYGRCPSSYGKGTTKCRVEGVLWSYDNLCLVVAVYSSDRELSKIVVINKNEVESLEIEDIEAMNVVYDAIAEANSGANERD